LPSVSINNGVAQIAYLFKDFIEALNTTSNTQQTVTGGIYSQTGVNLASFTINSQNIDTAEIANCLDISGGFGWTYDGYLPVENSFFLFPDSVEVTTATGSGGLIAQQYFYIAVYEWWDNQGNPYYSNQSIPVSITTTTSSSTNTINIPTLRLTYKTANPVKITLYRWSTNQQSYFQVTSISAATLNSTTTDSIAFVDALADSAIAGNDLVYTTGGVVPDCNPPATNIMTLFDDREWRVDAEDQNLLWFSKQIIQGTSTEYSTEFTYYVAPTTAAQGSTGVITGLAPMDDKLIIFKNSAIYYINGTGPDNTGANSQYPTSPIFITSAVGTTNQQSIVLTPQGLMFQSNKGIWLLGRDLSTQYIGAPVEAFNSSTVLSALNIPATNQIRFTLSTGQTLMYDYYYQQWGTFVGASAISSTIYQGLHTFINSLGEVFQETPGAYIDGSNPVLISLTTGPINIAGLQGYQRLYDFYLLGNYISPHFLVLGVSYEYSPYPTQQVIIQPNNYTGVYGSDQTFGQTSPFGGPGNLEQWRIHTQRQTCQSFNLTLTEQFNPAFGTVPGAGFTLSGIQCRVGIKKGVRPITAANSTG
jgi:hypothetical protein